MLLFRSILFMKMWPRSTRKRRLLLTLMLLTLGCCIFSYLAPNAEVTAAGKNDKAPRELPGTIPQDAKVPTLPFRTPPSSQPTSLDIFKHRKERLKAACKSRKMSAASKPPFSYHTMWVGSLAFCPLPKTGTTLWKRILYYVDQGLTGPLLDIDFGDIHRKTQYMANKSRFSTQTNYTRAVFVREPYSRLFATYVDKLFTPRRANWAKYGAPILRVTRPASHNEQVLCAGHDITFPEFVHYFIGVEKEADGISKDLNNDRDEHFVPVSNQCGFCRENYDLIGRQETFAEDTLGMLRQLNMSYLLTFADLQQISEQYEMNALIQYTFEHELDSLGPCMTREETLRRLWKALQIRGTISAEEFFPLSTVDCHHINMQSFFGLASMTYNKSATDPSRQVNRLDSMREAFSTISLEDRRLLRDIFDEDFNFFDYDPNNPHVFPENDEFVLPYYRYFDLFDSFLFVNGKQNRHH